MADMYGAIRSDWFKPKNNEEFRQWFEANCTFGDNIELWDADPEAKGQMAFGGYEQYPNAWPRIPADAEGACNNECAEWDLAAFAREIRSRLAEGETFTVLAAGHEKLRYVGATLLAIGPKDGDETFRNFYAGN